MDLLTPRMLKIGLGTAQFGMNYGISNQTGKILQKEASQILKLAAKSHIGYIDTAATYGDSESILGENFPSDHDFRLVTKALPFVALPSIEKTHLDKLRKTFEQSLKHLRCSTVYGLLVHHADDLTKPGGQQIFDLLQELKASGLVQNIGVSIYDAQQIDAILDRYSIDIIQLPVNIFDQRLIFSGHLKKLKDHGVEIHARSVFLQGLLLMRLERIPEYFKPILSHIYHYHEFLDHHGLTPLQSALKFVEGLKEVDRVICGVEHSRQLAELLQVSNIPELDYSVWAVAQPNMINPACWEI